METKKANSELTTEAVDLAGQNFTVAIEELDADRMKGAEATMIFRADTNGTFRIVKGSVLRQQAFAWHFQGDSLIIQNPKDSFEYEGKKKFWMPEPKYYAVTKEPNGFLLKGKDEQLLLTKQK